MNGAFQEKRPPLKYMPLFIALCLFLFPASGISLSADLPSGSAALEELSDSLSKKLGATPSFSVEYLATSREKRMNIWIIWDKRDKYIIMRLATDLEKPDWINFIMTYGGENKYWYLVSPEAGEGKRLSLKNAADSWNHVFGIFFGPLIEKAEKEIGDISFDTSGPFTPDIGLELTIDSFSAQIAIRNREYPSGTWFSPEKLSLAEDITSEGSRVTVRYPDNHATVLDADTGLLIEERWEDEGGNVFRSVKMVKKDDLEEKADFRSFLPGFETLRIEDFSVEESFEIFYASILMKAGGEIKKSPAFAHAMSEHAKEIQDRIYLRSRKYWEEKVRTAISSPSAATETMEKVLNVILIPAYEKMIENPEYRDLSLSAFLGVGTRSEDLRALLLDVRDVLLPGEAVDLGAYIETLPADEGAPIRQLYTLGEKDYLNGFIDAYVQGLIAYTKTRGDGPQVHDAQ